MPTTPQQLYDIRLMVGDKPSDPDVDDIFDGTGGSVNLTIQQILEKRLADLLIPPAQFSLVGEYQQTTTENIRQTKTQLQRARGVRAFRLRRPDPRR